MSAPVSPVSTRQYYLDWIRVLAFGILIFYHTGMFFVDEWGWHVKNDVTVEWLQLPMRWLGQWRLSLLFFVSGVGTSFALRSRTLGPFAAERTRRLLLPLLFGMFVVVPPQIYVERLWRGQFAGSYLDWYPSVFQLVSYEDGGGGGSLSWHHLWFVAYLWIFSLISLPIFGFFRTQSGQRARGTLGRWAAHPVGVYGFALLPLGIFYALVLDWPTTHNLVADWYNFAVSLGCFLLGYGIGGRDAFAANAERYRRRYAGLVLVFTTALFACFWIPDRDLETFDAAFISYGLLKWGLIWSVFLAIFGYARRYLNHRTGFLTYATEAVYPFYILHQTITVVVGYGLIDVSWPWGWKFLVLVVATFGGSWLIHHVLIRPFNPLRLLFGVKPRPARR
jgi:glucan biosynthesis protein C